MGLSDFPDFFDIISWKLIVLVILVCILRSWLKGQQFRGKESAKGLVAVVTGANVGIGKQIARELNIRGAKVYIFCRNKDRGDEGIGQLVHLGCNPQRLVLCVADLASFDSVRRGADFVKQREEKLDLLINNAGIMLYPKYQLTKDGHELTWQTNYLGHFLLTELLLPLLEAAPGGRMVNVSAVAHFYADAIDLASIDRRESWDSRQAYARSKLAQVMHAYELSKRLRLRGAAPAINACHPGICFTRLARHTPLATNPVLKYTLAPIAWFFLKTPKDGSQTPLYLALDKSLQGVSGKYFSECGQSNPSEASTDDNATNALYEYSLEACGLTAAQ